MRDCQKKLEGEGERKCHVGSAAMRPGCQSSVLDVLPEQAVCTMGRDTESVASLFLLGACTARKLGRSWERGVVQGVAKKGLQEDL